MLFGNPPFSFVENDGSVVYHQSGRIEKFRLKEVEKLFYRENEKSAIYPSGYDSVYRIRDADYTGLFGNIPPYEMIEVDGIDLLVPLDSFYKVFKRKIDISPLAVKIGMMGHSSYEFTISVLDSLVYSVSRMALHALSFLWREGAGFFQYGVIHLGFSYIMETGHDFEIIKLMAAISEKFRNFHADIHDTVDMSACVFIFLSHELYHEILDGRT